MAASILKADGGVHTEDFEHFAKFFREPFFLLSADGTVLSANTAATAQFEGAEGGGLKGKSLAALSADPAKATAYLRACSRSGAPLPGVLPLITNSGEAADFHCDAARLSEGDRGKAGRLILKCRRKSAAAQNFIALNQKIRELGSEISGRKKAEANLRASEEEFRLFFEAGPYGMVVTNAEGKITRLNARLEQQFGYTHEELLGAPIDMLVPNRFTGHADLRKGFFAAPVARQMGTGAVLYGMRKDQSEFPVEISLSPLETSEGAVVLAIVHDITERKKFEEKLQQAQKLESLGVLAGGIAHDFNNLLLAVIGNADLALLELPPASNARENLDAIVANAQRAADLCRQLLAYSGKGKFVIQVVSMSEVVSEMTHLLKISIGKNCALRYDFAENIPPIEVDLTQLRQIIMNLITNAADAIGGDQGVIFVQTGQMECDSSYLSETFLDDDLAEGPYVYMEVTDTGCGMDKEAIGKIFDPFYTTKATGRGLGLAAILGIVRGHKGALKVYSEPGKGTTFKVLFPSSTLQPESISNEQDHGGQWRGQGTILVVDDEQSVNRTAEKILQKAGFSVITAYNGREGIERYRERQSEIVAVLLDMSMPELNCEETFRQLRAIDGGVCVVLSSGFNEQEATLRFTGRGLAGFLQKPYRASELIEIMRSVLAKD